jgi:two-component system, response regulator
MNQVEILLVEDNENDAELALRALRKNNIVNNIIHIKDGPEAIDYVFCKGQYTERGIENIPKIILLDLKLPKMTGLEVLKAIKEDVRTKMIPVIMLTSSKEEPDIEKSYMLGANSYIVKPVAFDAFLDAMKNVGYYWMLINQSPNQ